MSFVPRIGENTNTMTMKMMNYRENKNLPSTSFTEYSRAKIFYLSISSYKTVEDRTHSLQFKLFRSTNYEYWSASKLNTKSCIVIGLTILLDNFHVREALEEETLRKGKHYIVLYYKPLISQLFIAVVWVALQFTFMYVCT